MKLTKKPVWAISAKEYENFGSKIIKAEETKELNEIENEVVNLERKIKELEEELYLLKNKIAQKAIRKKAEQVKIYENPTEDLTNSEIQEILNNHICKIAYIKKNGKIRYFNEFTFKENYRNKSNKSNFNYEKEVQRFVFGIELEEGQFKRLIPNNILKIEILK